MADDEIGHIVIPVEIQPRLGPMKGRQALPPMARRMALPPAPRSAYGRSALDAVMSKYARPTAMGPSSIANNIGAKPLAMGPSSLVQTPAVVKQHTKAIKEDTKVRKEFVKKARSSGGKGIYEMLGIPIKGGGIYARWGKQGLYAGKSGIDLIGTGKSWMGGGKAAGAGGKGLGASGMAGSVALLAVAIAVLVVLKKIWDAIMNSETLKYLKGAFTGLIGAFMSIFLYPLLAINEKLGGLTDVFTLMLGKLLYSFGALVYAIGKTLGIGFVEKLGTSMMDYAAKEIEHAFDSPEEFEAYKKAHGITGTTEEERKAVEEEQRAEQAERVGKAAKESESFWTQFWGYGQRGYEKYFKPMVDQVWFQITETYKLIQKIFYEIGKFFTGGDRTFSLGGSFETLLGNISTGAKGVAFGIQTRYETLKGTVNTKLGEINSDLGITLHNIRLEFIKTAKTFETAFNNILAFPGKLYKSFINNFLTPFANSMVRFVNYFIDEINKYIPGTKYDIGRINTKFDESSWM